MAVSNIMAAQDEIITRLKAVMPSYEKNILPMFDESEVKKNSQFNPSIFVVYMGMNSSQAEGHTAGNLKHARIEQQWGVFTIMRDSRGAAFNNALAGQVMLEIMTALQGVKLVGHSSPITLANTPRQYSIDDQNGQPTGAVSFPLIFKSEFIISGI